jgi:hypothetical protein
VREHVANSVAEIRKIDSADNYADPFTKALNSTDRNAFFYEVMCNSLLCVVILYNGHSTFCLLYFSLLHRVRKNKT